MGWACAGYFRKSTRSSSMPAAGGYIPRYKAHHALTDVLVTATLLQA